MLHQQAEGIGPPLDVRQRHRATADLGRQQAHPAHALVPLVKAVAASAEEFEELIKGDDPVAVGVHGREHLVDDALGPSVSEPVAQRVVKLHLIDLELGGRVDVEELDDVSDGCPCLSQLCLEFISDRLRVGAAQSPARGVDGQLPLLPGATLACPHDRGEQLLRRHVDLHARRQSAAELTVRDRAGAVHIKR